MVYLTPGIGLPVVGSEPAPAVLLAVPEIEVRVAPRRLRGLHLERVVVVTLVSIVNIKCISVNGNTGPRFNTLLKILTNS